MTYWTPEVSGWTQLGTNSFQRRIASSQRDFQVSRVHTSRRAAAHVMHARWCKNSIYMPQTNRATHLCFKSIMLYTEVDGQSMWSTVVGRLLTTLATIYGLHDEILFLVQSLEKLQREVPLFWRVYQNFLTAHCRMAEESLSAKYEPNPFNRGKNLWNRWVLSRGMKERASYGGSRSDESSKRRVRAGMKLTLRIC